MTDHCDNIKTQLEEMLGKGLSDKAKLVALLEACGISDREEVERLLECGASTLRTARQALKIKRSKSSGARNQALEIERQRLKSSETPEIERQNSSALACAHDACVETPSGLLIPEVVVLSPPPPKSAAGPTPTECLTAFEAYNSVALRCGLPQASKLTPKRQKAIRARIKEFGPGSWERALANIEQSKFLCGETKENFRADLDFVCQAKSFARLHDGGYGNGRHVKSVQSQITVKPPEPDWLKRQRFEREILEINGEV